MEQDPQRSKPLDRLLDDVDGFEESEDDLRWHVGLQAQRMDVPIGWRRRDCRERQCAFQEHEWWNYVERSQRRHRERIAAKAVGTYRRNGCTVEARCRLRIHRS